MMPVPAMENNSRKGNGNGRTDDERRLKCKPRITSIKVRDIVPRPWKTTPVYISREWRHLLDNGFVEVLEVHVLFTLDLCSTKVRYRIPREWSHLGSCHSDPTRCLQCTSPINVGLMIFSRCKCCTIQFHDAL